MMTTRNARNLAQQVLDLAWDGNLPVNPVRLASELTVMLKRSDGQKKKVGIVVRHQSNNELKGASSKGFVEKKDADLQYVISYNQDEVIFRNRFAVAHELGHLVLGYVTEGSDHLAHHTYNGDKPEDDMANKFALALLLPEKITRTLFPAAKTIQEFATAFGVSTTAAATRVRELGLL
jgi:Zn-dependent peptidase ImmA (M78 family)